MSDPLAPPTNTFRIENLPIRPGYALLEPERFHHRVDPLPLPAPYCVDASPEVAALIGLEASELLRPDFADYFSGNRLPPSVQTVATVYSGHQFGVWAGQLGDGRALLLGEVTGPSGESWEIQLKGSGQTPYSRMGDGRAVLRSSIREYLCSEAMHALGIPTTRALAVVGSDEPVRRESVETAAVVTRVAPSFVRFGSFEHFARAGQHDALRTLADHVIAQHFPTLLDSEDPYFDLLREVVHRTARLLAAWQSVGFCHGVMNTDNMSILGLTIDYGPFAFMGTFDPGFICNHSDTSGRYSYAMQPAIGEWNCRCLALALVPLLGSNERAARALDVYRGAFIDEFDRLLRAKLGLVAPHADDGDLFDAMFRAMALGEVDFTRFFRSLSQVGTGVGAGDDACRALFGHPKAFDDWLALYRVRLQTQAVPDAARARAMNRVNPKYILRTHLADTAIRAARGGEHARLGLGGTDAAMPQDFSEVRRLRELLSRPFDEQPEWQAYADAAPAWAASIELSCSS